MRRNHLAYLVGLLLSCAVDAMAAQATGPTPDYKIDAEHTATSPDGTTTIEQYAKTDADGNYTWQFWARRPESS